MSGSSRDRVTITLGRSGQVVKRAVSDAGYPNSLPSAGNKRSLRDRLGTSSDDSYSRGNRVASKRQRADGSLTGWNGEDEDDTRIGRGDLRLKLIQKNVLRRVQNHEEQRNDLREKLSRAGQHPTSNHETRQIRPESMETNIMRRIPLARSADDLGRVEPSRSSYPWTLDHIRQNPPEGLVRTSRRSSPPRSVDDLQRRPRMIYDDLGAASYTRKDVDIPRIANRSPYLAKPPMPPVAPKPAAPPIAQPPPSSTAQQKNLYKVEEQLTVDGLLHSLGLAKYSILFKAEEVDMPALKQMGENDLKEIGIPMGPRKKILLSLMPRTRRQQPQPHP